MSLASRAFIRHLMPLRRRNARRGPNVMTQDSNESSSHSKAFAFKMETVRKTLLAKDQILGRPSTFEATEHAHTAAVANIVRRISIKEDTHPR